MWNLPQSRSPYVATKRRRRRRTASVVLAVVAIAGLMLASAAPVSADKGYDWEEFSDNWESSRDPGGWDAHVSLSYERGGEYYWITAEFSAYGEHFWAENRSEHPAMVSLAVQEFVEFEDWIYLHINPGECITWGWERPPENFPECFYLGDNNIYDDDAVVIQICGYDPVGWTCLGEDAEA